MSEVADALEHLSQVIYTTLNRYEEENLALKKESAELKSDIAYLRDQLEAFRQEAFSRAESQAELNLQGNSGASAGEPERYHGCYNTSGRKTPIRSAAEAIIILGGQKVLGEALGISPDTIGYWATEDGRLPAKFRDQINEMMKERGFFVDQLLYRRGRNEGKSGRTVPGE